MFLSFLVHRKGVSLLILFKKSTPCIFLVYDSQYNQDGSWPALLRKLRKAVPGWLTKVHRQLQPSSTQRSKRAICQQPLPLRMLLATQAVLEYSLHRTSPLKRGQPFCCMILAYPEMGNKRERKGKNWGWENIRDQHAFLILQWKTKETSRVK